MLSFIFKKETILTSFYTISLYISIYFLAHPVKAKIVTIESSIVNLNLCIISSLFRFVKNKFRIVGKLHLKWN